jgi:hypothetical protein
MEKGNRPEAFGVFKPVGHVIVAFPAAQDMEGAAEALADEGFQGADCVRYAPGEMARQAEQDIAAASGLATIGQELNLVKAHLELARQGYSFLVVHAPDDAQARRVAEVARRFHATRAQKYGRFMIEELIEVGSDQAQVAESPDRGLDAQTVSGREGAADLGKR